MGGAGERRGGAYADQESRVGETAIDECRPIGGTTGGLADHGGNSRERLERNLVQEAMVTLRAMCMEVMQGEVERVARIMWEQHSKNYCSEVAQQWGEAGRKMGEGGGSKTWRKRMLAS